MMFTDLWNHKYHFVEIDVPALKILGITIRRARKICHTVDCPMGQSARERIIEAGNKPNIILAEALKRAGAEK